MEDGKGGGWVKGKNIDNERGVIRKSEIKIGRAAKGRRKALRRMKGKN